MSTQEYSFARSRLPARLERELDLRAVERAPGVGVLIGVDRDQQRDVAALVRHQLESGLTVAEKSTQPEKPGNPGDVETYSAVMSADDPPSPAGSENEIVESAPAAPARSTAVVAPTATAAVTRPSRSGGDVDVAMWQL